MAIDPKAPSSMTTSKKGAKPKRKVSATQKKAINAVSKYRPKELDRAAKQLKRTGKYKWLSGGR